MKQEEKMQLARILSTVDEQFLVALANKGLVRRAQKDLEVESLAVREEAEAIVVSACDWTVWMPVEGPTKARDDTKASGVTRQILAATMHLRDFWVNQILGMESVNEISHDSISDLPSDQKPSVSSPAQNPSRSGSQATGASLAEELIALDDEVLSKWVGRKLFLELIALLKEPLEVQVEVALSLIVRLPQQDIELRLLPTKSGGVRLLDEILSTAPKALHKRWVCAAILAMKMQKGIAFDSELVRREFIVSSPRLAIVLNEIHNLAGDILGTGIVHVSDRIRERLLSLSVSASVVQLPRLANLLHGISDEVALILNRHAAGDSQRLFSTLSLVDALVCSLRYHLKTVGKLPVSLAGVARSQYLPAGDLSLSGVGCFSWMTKSGFEGVTSLFWEHHNSRFLTWSTSRPAGTMGFDLESVYLREPVWSMTAPQQLARSKFVLKDASLNQRGRVSGSGKTTVADISTVNHDEINFGQRQFIDWSAVRLYALEQLAAGLAERNPLDRVVVLKVRSWGRRYFEELRQMLHWEVLDQAGGRLRLSVSWSPANEPVIDFLESLKPDLEHINRVIVRIGATDEGLLYEPIAFLSPGIRSGDTILNPSFDAKLIESKQSGLLAKLKAKFRPMAVKTILSQIDEDDEILNFSNTKGMSSQLAGVLSEAENLLLQVAESGTNYVAEQTLARFGELGNWLCLCGVLEFGESLKAIASTESGGGKTAHNVMFAEYICKLLRQESFLLASD